MRFPVALVIAVVGTVAAVLLMERGISVFGVSDDILQRLAIAACFGMPLAVSAVLIAESRGYTRMHTRLFELCAAMLSAVFYIFVLPDLAHWYTWDSYRSTLLVLAEF